MWTRDRVKLTQAMIVDPLYLQHNNSDKSIDYRVRSHSLSSRWRLGRAKVSVAVYVYVFQSQFSATGLGLAFPKNGNDWCLHIFFISTGVSR